MAERIGVTPSNISQIEKNLIYPSLPALFRLAESLGMDVASFFDGLTAVPVDCVFRGEEGFSAVFEKSCKGIVTGQRLLPPDISETCVDPYLLKIEPGRKLTGHFFSHKGEEAGYLLKGRLGVWLNGRREEAGVGDFIYFRKDIPEQWENIGDDVAELLWLKLP